MNPSMFILHSVCKNMQCTINRASSFLFLDFDLKHLKWQVPSQVDVVFVLVHPDFCYPQGISLHGHAQVRHVGLVVPLNVGDLGARNYFNTASTCPHLYEGGKKRLYTIIVQVQICQAILTDTPGSHCSVKSHQMQKAPHHNVDIFILWIYVLFN